MSEVVKSSRVTLASTLGVLGFLLSVLSLGWQVHVHEESLTDKALVRFSIAFSNGDTIVAIKQTGKHTIDVEEDPSIADKADLRAEVVNMGQRPLYVKKVRLIVPCPETKDSDSIDFQPPKDSPPALEPGAAITYKAGPWKLSEHPLGFVDPPEQFCITVESNQGMVTQTDEVSNILFSMSEKQKLALMQKTEKPVRDPLGIRGPENKDLRDCLKKVNPGDPAGLRGETQAQATARKACIDRYAH